MKPNYMPDDEFREWFAHKKTYTHDHGNGNKTCYIQYVDGMEVYDLCPKMWNGWKKTRVALYDAQPGCTKYERELY